MAICMSGFLGQIWWHVLFKCFFVKHSFQISNKVASQTALIYGIGILVQSERKRCCGSGEYISAERHVRLTFFNSLEDSLPDLLQRISSFIRFEQRITKEVFIVEVDKFDRINGKSIQGIRCLVSLSILDRCCLARRFPREAFVHIEMRF